MVYFVTREDIFEPETGGGHSCIWRDALWKDGLGVAVQSNCSRLMMSFAYVVILPVQDYMQ